MMKTTLTEGGWRALKLYELRSVQQIETIWFTFYLTLDRASQYGDHTRSRMEFFESVSVTTIPLLLIV